MLGGAIFREALGAVRRLELPQEAERDYLAVLEAGRVALPFINEATFEQQGDRARALRRAAGIYTLFCAGSLGDDLIDGEVHYLPDPVRTAPSIQFALQALGTGLLLESGVPADVLAQASFELVRAASLVQIENRTSQWTLAPYRAVAEAVSGRQYVAFLSMLWAGTPLAAQAAGVGLELGTLSRILKDVTENKDRFFTLNAHERRAVLDWAHELLELGRARDLSCARLVVASLEPVLARVDVPETLVGRPSEKLRAG